MKKRCLDHDWYPKPLPDNVEIGARSWLYSSFAFTHFTSAEQTGVQIGEDTGLYNGTFFDLGPSGAVRIGNYCTLVGVIIASNHRVIIGDYCFLAHEVVLSDSGIALPGGVQYAEQRPCAEDPPKGIVIEENVWIGARAILLDGAHIGEGSIVGAAAVVNFRVPENSIVAGNPAQVVRRIT